MRLARRPANPVLVRELRARARSPWAWALLPAYLGALGGATLLLYRAAGRSAVGYDGPSALVAPTVGRAVFHAVAFLVLVAVCFLVPGLTAGTVAGERERRTLLALRSSPLGPGPILAGKLLASLAQAALLVVAAAPFAVVAFLVGGVTAAEAGRAGTVVLAAALALGCLSLGCSTLARRAQGATVAAYALALALVVGPFAVYGAQVLVSGGEGGGRRDGNGRSKAVLALSPLVATADAVASLAPDEAAGLLPSPFGPVHDLILTEEAPPFSDGSGFAEGGEVFVDGVGAAEDSGPPTFFGEPGGPPATTSVGSFGEDGAAEEGVVEETVPTPALPAVALGQPAAPATTSDDGVIAGGVAEGEAGPEETAPAAGVGDRRGVVEVPPAVLPAPTTGAPAGTAPVRDGSDGVALSPEARAAAFLVRSDGVPTAEEDDGTVEGDSQDRSAGSEAAGLGKLWPRSVGAFGLLSAASLLVSVLRLRREGGA